MKPSIRAFMAIATAGCLASAAFGQAVSTPAPEAMPPAGNAMPPAGDKMSPAPDSMPPAGNAMPPAGNTMPPAQAEAPAAMQQDDAAVPMLQQRDGKWMNGDKPATKAEIAAYKRQQKLAKPK